MSTILVAPDIEMLRRHPEAAFPPKEWDVTAPAARWTRAKARLFDKPREIDSERARYTTDSYRRTEGLPMSVRRARMLLDLAWALSISIDPDELIVGNRSRLTPHGRGCPRGGRRLGRPRTRYSAHSPTGQVLDRAGAGPRVPRGGLSLLARQNTRGRSVAGIFPRISPPLWARRRSLLHQTDHALRPISCWYVVTWLSLGIGGLAGQGAHMRRAGRRSRSHRRGSSFTTPRLSPWKRPE